MLFDRFQCIFVRISKVASTSILNAFLQQKTTEDTGNFDWMHHDLQHYHDSYPNVFDSYFKFAFVRNPWDRIYSQYRYLRYNRNEPFAQATFRDFILACEDFRQRDACLFGRNSHIFRRHTGNQLDWLTVNGVERVDFIGRFENLQADFAAIARRLGVELHLAHDNQSAHPAANYHAAYDPQTSELVASWHSKDIERFGYVF